MIDNWVMRKRPARLERRFEFADYEETREFLDRAAELAEREDYFPDMSFGRTHVSMTLSPREEGGEVDEALMEYARQVDALLPATPLSDESAE